MHDALLLPALLSSPTAAFVGASADGTITRWSTGAAALLGWTEDEIVGCPLAVLVPEDRRDELSRRTAVLAGEHPPPFETVRLARDGSPVDVEIHVVPVPDEGGAPVGMLALYRDLRRTRVAEARLRETAERFDALLATMPVAVFSYDRTGCCTSWRGETVSGLGCEETAVGRPLLDLAPQLPAAQAAVAASLAGQDGRAVVDDGERAWKCHFRPVRDVAGEVVGGMGVAVDVTQLASAERAVRADEARLEALLRSATDVVVVLDGDGRLVYVSPAVTARLGYDPHELFWRRVDEYGHPDDAAAVRAGWRAVAGTAGATATYECRVRHADGTWRWTEQVVTNLLDDPDVRGIVVNVRDITDRRQAQSELEHLALHDALTGLPNRALLLDRIRQALSWERRSDTLTGLVLLDVVGLAAVNEAVGYAGGDAVLRSLAGRLREAVRETDSIARTGGGELAVLVEDVASAEDLRARATNLVDVLSGPVTVGGVTVDVVLRAASVMTPAADEGALLAAAERALAGPRPVARVVLERAAVAGAALDGGDVAELRRAVESGQLRLHYQPVLRLDTGEVAGAEALVRWQHPERGLLPPSEFVPLAESSGVVVELGAWVLREACRQAAQWHADGRPLGVGLNLSPRQMVGRDVVDLVRDALADSGLDPGRVVLEVTESTLMDDADAPEVLQALRRLGVRLALDDFGTGYSSLTYLKRFPIDAIKIDRSFVSGLGRDPDDEAIVASVVSLARSVGKLVVAEGVETVGQLAVLRSLGVDQGQGFLWSPALPAAELDAWLTERRSPPAPAPAPAPAPPTATGRHEAGRSEVVIAPTEDEVRILQLHRQGASLHTIAAALNAEGRRTPAGPRWTPTTVARVVASLSRRV